MYSKDIIYLLGFVIIIINTLILLHKDKIKSNIVLNSALLLSLIYTLNQSLQLGILLSSTFLILNQ